MADQPWKKRHEELTWLTLRELAARYGWSRTDWGAYEAGINMGRVRMRTWPPLGGSLEPEEPRYCLEDVELAQANLALQALAPPGTPELHDHIYDFKSGCCQEVLGCEAARCHNCLTEGALGDSNGLYYFTSEEVALCRRCAAGMPFKRAPKAE